MIVAVAVPTVSNATINIAMPNCFFICLNSKSYFIENTLGYLSISYRDVLGSSRRIVHIKQIKDDNRIHKHCILSTKKRFKSNKRRVYFSSELISDER